MKEPILVWRFKDAPKELQNVIEPYGNEQWLAVLPSYWVGKYIGLLESPAFSSHDVKEYPHPSVSGWVIKIGCH